MEPIPSHPHIIWYDSLDSTNSEVRRHVSELDNLSIIAAKSQSAGRGQGTHSWFATPSKNLTFSLLIRFPVGSGAVLHATDIILITCAITLGIRDYLLSRGIEARIKWPNDIWVEDRKICGILIENILEGPAVRESIVGIGLNVNQENWPEDLPNPVSMSELSGRRYDIEDELVSLGNDICRRVAMIGDISGRQSLQGEFERFMFRLP